MSFYLRSAASAASVLFLCVCMAPTLLAQGTVATPVISPADGGIAPAGLDVTVTCETGGATIYYTLDGTDPTDASTPYAGTVHLDEQTGLTAIKTVTFKAKAFVGAEESAVATAQFTNFVDPEFSMLLDVEGTEDTTVTGVSTLEFGFLTGATDNYDALYDNDGAALRDDTRDEPPVPLPPVVDIRFITADSLLTSIDYRSRAQTKEFPLQAQLIPGGDGTPAEIVLRWGHDAANGFGLPPAAVPFLGIYRRTAANGDTLVGDLTQAGSLTINRADWPAEADEYEDTDDNYRVFYIVYRNIGTLTANLSPEQALGEWYYRGLDEDEGTLHGPYASAETVSVYPGDYEVSFGPSAANTRDTYYTPPSQTVTVAAEETTTVEATYTTAPASAAMTVVDTYYDPTEAGTVRVTCSFTYSPDLALQSLVWDFATPNPPADWTLDSLSGTDAASASLAGRTVTFANARAIPAGSTIEFTANFTYGVQDDPAPTATFTPTVTANFTELAQPFVIDDLSGTSEPRSATLDVNGDGRDTKRDLILILRSLPRAQGGLAQSGDALFPEGGPQAGDNVDSATLADNIAALLALLDVNGSGTANRRDLILILRSLPRAQGGLAQSGDAIFPEGAPQADDAVDATALEQNIQAILTEE